MPTFGSLFAGIGGIDLGLERAGWECRFQVEWDEFCQRVLAKHWPDVPRFGDIHDVHGPLAHTEGAGRKARSGDRLRTDEGEGQGLAARSTCPRCLPPVDLLAGGFPCQPFSVAGKQRRLEDDRWLWPEFARAIRELRPRFVLVENVPGLLVGGGMDAVLGDLADLGYDAEWESIPAAAVGAPHLRYRVWIVAYARRLSVQPDSGPGEAPRTSGEIEGEASQRQWRGYAAGNGRENARTLAHPDSTGPQGRPIQPERPGERAAGPGGVADPTGERWRPEGIADAGEAAGRWSLRQPDGSDWWSVEPDVGRVAHGVPARVDRLRSLGNAVVPQVVEVIGQRILEQVA